MNENICLVAAQNLNVSRGGAMVLQQLHFSITAGQHWAVVGPSGSGKTTLLQVLAGQVFATGSLYFQYGLRRVLVPQQHRFTNLSHTSDFYYQQRFNASDAEDAATVATAFPQLFTTEQLPALVQSIAKLFSLDALQNRSLIQLSNGENKRLQLAQALLQNPQLLLLDNPFVGLDVSSRIVLEKALAVLGTHGITVVLTSLPHRIPPFITHVLELKQGAIPQVHQKEHFHPVQETSHRDETITLPPELLSLKKTPAFAYAVRMHNVQVRYGQKQVLHNLSWEVRRGERWLLSGPNGAGKSTLLNLITADNPQAYANEIYLFDKRRGTGESIWDIKRNIGYVSPELHLYFDAGASVFDAVASGLFDTIGLFRQLSVDQEKQVMQWLKFLKLDAFKNRLLSQMPLGQQRLVLLARALVKNPPLLVLDEPLQGLDETQARFFNGVIDALCTTTDQTMIFVSHYTDDLPVCINKHLRLENGSVMK